MKERFEHKTEKKREYQSEIQFTTEEDNEGKIWT